MVPDSSDIITTPGSTIRERLVLQDAAGEPVDLLGVTLSIVNYNRAAIANMTVTVEDAEAGIAVVELAAGYTTPPAIGGADGNLLFGRVNHFALKADFALSEAALVFDRIWIEVAADV